MSATTSSTFRHPAGEQKAETTALAPSSVDRVVSTSASFAGTVARLTLGIVMFPHGAQHVLGWFGGQGWSAAMDMFTNKLHIPAPLAAIAVLVEFFGSIALIIGAFSRIAALGILGLMVGAIVTVHLPNGFFMNWFGQKAGEGFEYHLLAIGLALVTVVVGGGRGSIDYNLWNRRHAIRG
ncbi:MAG: DoxX family protein [Polyangiaceae bacterium]|nr:DoxX family protein [Polyangiaceae bacterium]